jgi:hypothetical protein
MIALTEAEEHALRAIVRAGADGLVLDGRELKLSHAVRLEMARFVTIDHSRPQTVRATQQGVAHSRRAVWA